MTIQELYDEIREAFKNKRYFRVENLIKKALKIPEFGFDRNILYQYGISLIRINKVEEGIFILKKITELDEHPKMLAKITQIISNWEEIKKIKLPIAEYLSKGYELKEGLVVYLKSKKSMESERFPEDVLDFSYMIWRIENNRVYAFPVSNRKNHGHFIHGSKYFKSCDQTAEATLVSFDVDNISRVDIQLEAVDYNLIIKDLYERYCVLGTINNTPKNYFVTEYEKKISIAKGDIISIFNISDRHPHYYCVIGVDEENSTYRIMETTHIKGKIVLKNDAVIEMPFSSYIMEKITISPENRERIMETVPKIDGLERKRTLKQSIDIN